MTKKRLDSMLIGAPDIHTLEMFVQFLNGRGLSRISQSRSGQGDGKDQLRADQLEVRRLVQAWFRSGPNVKELFKSESVLAHEAMNIRVALIPGTYGAKLAILDIGTNDDPRDPLSNAIGIFVQFLLNQENKKLGGPCRHCQKYFVKQSDRKRIYCSDICGHKNTGVDANRRRRTEERKRRLERALRSKARWEKAKTTVPWKVWVSRDPLISMHFLTKAVRNGEIQEPKMTATPQRDAKNN